MRHFIREFPSHEIVGDLDNISAWEEYQILLCSNHQITQDVKSDIKEDVEAKKVITVNAPVDDANDNSVYDDSEDDEDSSDDKDDDVVDDVLRYDGKKVPNKDSIGSEDEDDDDYYEDDSGEDEEEIKLTDLKEQGIDVNEQSIVKKIPGKALTFAIPRQL